MGFDVGHVFTATILHHIPNEVREKFKIRAVNDGAADPTGAHELGIAHVSEMK